MPSQDDIVAQQALLEAHRQTLHVLLGQQARLGADFAPPAIASGIAEARGQVARIKAVLRGWGASVEDMPDDEAPPEVPPAADTARSHAMQSGGDLIVGNVGAGAQGVAIGKDIVQTLGGVASQQDDQRAIGELLARLDRDLAAGTAQLGAAAGVAAGYLRLLAGELSKTGDRATPSASTLTLVGDWLLDNAAPLREALGALFAAPAVRRVLARADAPLDAWLQRRFGT
jgi:hypothetical protein